MIMVVTIKDQNTDFKQEDTDSLEKTLVLGKIKGRKRMGQEDEMVGWHRRLHGQEFEKTLGDGEGQGSLACCSLWGHKELDMTE